MDTIEKIEKDLNQVINDRFDKKAPLCLHLRIQIEIAKQLRGLTATIKNLRDV